MASQEQTNLADKQVFTTGEAAEICKVSQQTIIRCFDSGRIQGFRVPGSRFRRIPRDEMIRFMSSNSIPTDALTGGKKRILIVDDDPDIIELLQEVLGHDERFDTQCATTGYDAGVQTESFRPDLIILDYMLPDINGNIMCRTVRQNQRLSHTKVIIVSGLINQNQVDELLQEGADDFLQKPFHIEELLQRIAVLLQI